MHLSCSVFLWLVFLCPCICVAILRRHVGSGTPDQELKEQHWLITDQLWCIESGMSLLQTEQNVDWSKTCLLCLQHGVVGSLLSFSATLSKWLSWHVYKHKRNSFMCNLNISTSNRPALHFRQHSFLIWKYIFATAGSFWSNHNWGF